MIRHDAFGFEVVEDEVADTVFTDAGERDRPQTESGGGDGDVRRTAAHHGLEVPYLLERLTDVSRIEIHVGPANRDQVICHRGVSSGVGLP